MSDEDDEYGDDGYEELEREAIATKQVAFATGQAAMAMFAEAERQQQEKKQKVDHRLLPRGEKTV